MKKWLGLFGLCAAALLSACGGGGGSSGDTQEQYSITLRADQTSLPLNVSGYPAGVGVNYPYSTTLYVNVKEGSDAVQDGAAVNCNMTSGLSSGALYYFDGDTSHQTTDSTTGATTENAYRSIALTTSSGGASFHFSAADIAGTATISCSVTDPRDSRVYTASVGIKVGTPLDPDQSSNPASIQIVAQSRNPLGVQNNGSNLPTSVVLQAYVWDDANQPVRDPSGNNLQVSISPIGGNAWVGACLQVGPLCQQNTSISTTNGVGSISLSSGRNTGVIWLQFTADRYDNNVSNGLQDGRVTQWFPVSVTNGVADTPLAFDPVTIAVTNGALFAQPLSATGGVAPYTWTALDPLPTGLSLSADGVISGTPTAAPGTYVVNVQVADALSPPNKATARVTITVAPAASLVIGNSSVSAMVNAPFSYALSVTGGVPPVTWTVLGPLPAGLTIDGNGLITGTPTVAGNYTVAIRVTDSMGNSATGNLSIVIAPQSLVITTTSISTRVGLPMSYTLSASGGVAPLTWAALGPLPAGLHISSDGMISGTPTGIGTYLVVIQVTDSKGIVATGNLSITVTAASSS